MKKIIPLIFSVLYVISSNGQAVGGWGTCEFATVAAMNAFDPSSNAYDCKKVFVQATNEHYYWNGTAWTLVQDTDDQTLSLSSDILSISEGNSVNLSTYLDNTDDQVAVEVPFTPVGTIAATDVQAAITEIEPDIYGSVGVHSDVDITTTTPTSGDVLAWDGTTFVPSSTNNGFTIFNIFAEESAELGAGNREWAFGNGDNTPTGHGIVIPIDCELFAMSLDHEGGSNSTVQIIKNTDLTLSAYQVSNSGAETGYVTFGTPLSFTAGDVANFTTITASPTGTSGRVSAWFRVRSTPASTSLVNDLLDVSAGSIANGDVLYFDGSSFVPLTLEAANIPITDLGNNFTATNVEDALTELATATAENIYTSSGTLTGDRTITQGSFDINFDANTLFIDGPNSRVGVGTNSPERALHLVDDNMRVSRSSNTAGMIIDRYEAGTGTVLASAIIGVESSSAGTGELILANYNENVSGTYSKLMSFNIANNQAKFYNYGAGTYTGTLSRILGVEADGDIIEVDATSLGTDDQTAAEVSIADAGNNFAATNVEDALTELATATPENIYTTDDALTGDRNLTFGSFDMNFDANTLFIDGPNNRVGVGTNAPTNVLTARGEEPQVDLSDNSGVRLQLGYSESNTVLSNSLTSQLITNTNGDLQYSSRTSTSSNHIFYTPNSGTPTERMRLTTGGNLGIGTNNPQSNLQIGNNVGSGSSFDNFEDYQLLLYQSGTPQTSYGLGIEGSTFALNTGVIFDFKVAGTDRMTLSSTGLNVVNRTTTNTFTMTNGAANGYLLQSDGSGNASWVDPTPFTNTDAQTLGLSGTTLSISGGNSVNLSGLADNLGNHTATTDLNMSTHDISFSSGEVNFGSTTRQMLNLWSTSYGIGVQGSTQYYRSSAHFAWYRGGSHNNSTFNNGGGTTMMILSNAGNLGIGTTGAPTRRLQVDGGTVRFSDYGSGTQTGTETFLLGVDANGDVVEVAATDLENNIYTNDGDLGEDRIVTFDGNSLTFEATRDIVFAADGSVGIGTTPSQDFDVNGVSLFRNGNSATSFTNDQIQFSWNGGDQYRHAIKTRHNGGADTGNSIDFYLWDAGTDATTAVGSRQVMTLDGNNNGSVGIGTTTPGRKLDVAGNIELDNNLYINNKNTLQGSDTWLRINQSLNYTSGVYIPSRLRVDNEVIFNDVGGNHDFRVEGDTDQNLIRVDASTDRVGIGIGNPGGKLHVYEGTGTAASANNGSIVIEHGNAGGSSSVVFKSRENAGSDYGYINYSDDGSGNGGNTENSLLEIGVQNDGVTIHQDDIAIMPTGYVGIGTRSPDAKLDVEGGSVRFSNYGSGTYDATDATRALGVQADGDIVEINTATSSRIFYPPAIAIVADAVVTNQTLDLHQTYVDLFGGTDPSFVKSTSAPTTIPTYGEDDLYYYVLNYDTDIFENVSLDDNGVLTYDIKAVATDNCSFINVVFVVK